MTATLDSTNIRGNSAGSALVITARARVRLQQSSVVNANAAIAGPAAAVWGRGVLDISGRCQLSGNTATTYGGALYVIGSSQLNVSNALLEGNSAANGGAIYFNQMVKASLVDTILALNEAEEYGGAMEVRCSAAPAHEPLSAWLQSEA